MIRRYLTLLVSLLTIIPIHAQMPGKWLAYEGSDGSELIVTISSGGSGKAELTLTRRHEAVSYAEGRRYRGTFRTTGGYYFLVNGSKTANIRWSQTDSTFTISSYSTPAISVKAWLDEAYSTREISDYGDYKKQIVAQWKSDFPTNEDVKKYKWIMEHYFTDYYDDAFDVLLQGNYQIVEQSDDTIVLQNLDLAIPPLTWQRIQ